MHEPVRLPACQTVNHEAFGSEVSANFLPLISVQKLATKRSNLHTFL